MAATFGAFFVSQRLKNAESVAEYTKLRHYFSPNGDGVRDVDRITFKVEKADRLTITVVNRDGDRVRRLATGVDARPERPVTVVWDGRSDDGIRAPDGRYRLQVGLRRTGRTVTIPGAFNVDTTAPKPVVVSVKPADRRAGGGRVRDPRPARREPPRAALPRPAHRPRRAEGGRALPRPQGQPAAPSWDGKVNGAARAARDLHGRRPRPRPGRQPRHRARRAPARPRPGARQAGHHRPRARGAAARGGGARRRARRVRRRRARRAYRWDVRRVGASRPVEEGRAAAGKRTLVLRSPRGVSGVYLLELRSGSSADARAVPRAVAASARSCSSSSRPPRGSASTRSTTTATACRTRSRTAARWSGRGAYSAAAARARRRHRAAAHLPRPRGDQLRPHLGHRARPLRRADREPPRGRRCSPARCGGSRARSRVACAATSSQAGALASFGTESMRRGVRITDDVLARPTQPTPTDPFGARLEPVAVPRTEDDGRTPLPLTALTEDPVARPPHRLGRHAGCVRPPRGVGQAARHAEREAADRPRPGRLRQRAREGRGQGRAAARGAAGARRHAARQGRSRSASA